MARLSDSTLQSFKQELRNRVSILEVVSEHVVLRKAGSNHMGLCPFHSERSPSFTVNESKQMFHCFGCKKGGDLISFVMEVHGLGFMEALEELAERAKMPLPRELAEQGSKDDPERAKLRQQEREKLQLAFRLNRFAASFYREKLVQVPEAQSYFRKRGIDSLENQGLSRNFYLGVAPSGWDFLAKHLTQAKAPLALANELGLVRPSPRGSGYFDLFRGRAIFPILDLKGKVVGFGGRSIPDLASTLTSSEIREAGPKYLNSPESFIFRKGKLAYGLFQAQKHIRETDEVVLVEGYFDVLGLHAGGFQNTVATCGTALTLEHLQLFKRLGKKMTLLFDSDRAGDEATERAMELGLSQGLVLHGANLPRGVDPDEVIFDPSTGAPIPGGAEQMRAILGAAQPLIDVRIQEAIRSASGGPEALSSAIKKIGQWLKGFSDPVGQEVRVRSVSQSLSIEARLLWSSMGLRPRSGGTVSVARSSSAPEGGATGTTTRLSPLNKQERVVLRGIIRGGEFSDSLTKIRAQMPPGTGIWELFDHPEARHWVEKWGGDPASLERLKQSPAEALSGVPAGQVLTTITEALVSVPEDLLLEEFQQALKARVGRAWVRFSQHIKKALGAAEASQDAELQAKLMQEYVDVQRKIKEFTSFYDEAD